jgi:hypothetical protein
MRLKKDNIIVDMEDTSGSFTIKNSHYNFSLYTIIYYIIMFIIVENSHYNFSLYNIIMFIIVDMEDR